MAGLNEGARTALLELLSVLKRRDYRFVTITPASHARVASRRKGSCAKSVEDVLGWSLPFPPGGIDTEVERLLSESGMLERTELLLSSRLRVSSLGDWLFIHSAYPTDAPEAVFFGPDSYRFADLIRRELGWNPLASGANILDIGTGSGVGAVVAASLCPSASVSMTDINAQALEFAGVNVAAAGYSVTPLLTGRLEGAPDPVDLAVANPPYIVDERQRAYRDGGDLDGAALSLDMAGLAIQRLAPGGRLILYTGSAIVRGEDRLHMRLERLVADAGCDLRYREIDPDIFGEELERDAYSHVDRIAAVAAVVTRQSGTSGFHDLQRNAADPEGFRRLEHQGLPRPPCAPKAVPVV